MQELESLSIAIVGAMNSRIHHPAWYKIPNILTDAEIEHALKSDLVTTEPIAQFNIGRLVITCTQARWDVRTSDPDYFVRAKEIAAKTFTILEHTPIKAFGINLDSHRQTKVVDVAKFIGEKLSKADFGVNDLASGKVVLEKKWQQAVCKAQVERSPSDAHGVFVQINMHYDMSHEGFYDLGQKIEEAFAPSLGFARDLTANIVSSFKQ